ncbi:flagellar hook-length control protein FliK [Novosphingobium sp.]|uniref:flagellar hook-length control protein FliK n=1 Tax=Novosphingobium sp. TaxID=1874826 RepID=UPI0028A90FB8|nr:flagellar hook-length control protein FliK [Novosphingobium sp.]
MAAAAVGPTSAADSLAGALKGVNAAAGSFQSLLGAARLAPTKTAVPAGSTAPEQAAASDPAVMPATAADTLTGEMAPLPQVAAEPALPETPAADAKPVGKDQSAAPSENAGSSDKAPVAEHIKPQVAARQPLLSELVKQAASPESADAGGETQAIAVDEASDDADAPAAKHGEADAADIVPVLQVQVPQTAQTAPAASLQPQLAVGQQAVNVADDGVAGDAAKDKSEGAGKVSAKSAKAGTAAIAFEKAVPEASAPRSQGTIATAAGAAEAAPDQAPSSTDTSLSTPLFTQTLTGTASRPAALPYAPAPQTAAQSATVSVQQGQFGNDIGVEIARALDKGSDDLLIRLDPRHMGRIDVRLSFDHDGVLRAIVSADSASSLDMLRRESTDLGRALADAGVRSDGQSLRFDSRSGGQGGGRWQGDQQGQHQAGHQSQGGGLSDGFGGSDDPIYRPLRSSGHVDLMA